MPTRTSYAVWSGDLRNGSGIVALGSGSFEGRYTFLSRFAQGEGTNPEELIGASHAGCYSMFLAEVLAGAGFTADTVTTSASVTIGDGPAIVGIRLTVEAVVPGLDEEAFASHVETATAGYPISTASGAVPIVVDAILV
ncbi:OsmC family peroxiredoxin [Catenuloplanes japonicus]|uniref:OsmC family peroxiredoxin n=1 Tax=Catenuloplanes japonicus TaxID=33876 RepID=UPI0005273429|nr:OsmC family peroxiredoxin [Catenuloplanes japonicus]